MKKPKKFDEKEECRHCMGTGQIDYDECGFSGTCEYCKYRWALLNQKDLIDDIKHHNHSSPFLGVELDCPCCLHFRLGETLKNKIT